MPSLVEVARKLVVGELVLLFELRVLGQPRSQAEIPEELIPTLRARLGSEIRGTTQIDEGMAERIREDNNPRRRVLRRLSEKLNTYGKWAPSGISGSTLTRGFPDAGEAREALDMMRKVSWVVVTAAKRHGDPQFALNPEFRAEILDVIEHSTAETPEALTKWFAEKL